MFTRHTLKNGIRVILSPKQDTAAAALLVLVKVGSRYELPSENGIAHFVEHLIFKGTKRRPTTLSIAQELDCLGADYNAFTAKDHTGFYIKAESINLPLIVDMLSDILTESLFDKAEVEKERGAILEEINMYEDNPMARVGEFFEESMFGQNTPLGRRIIGSHERLKSITQKQIINFWKKHYQGKNIVLALAGNFKTKPALALLSKKFSQISAGALNHPSAAKLIQGAAVASHHKKTNQAHIVIGWPSIHNNHPDRFALTLLAIILGGNMSSRLFIQVREKLGLCYFINAAASAYEDTGTFDIQAGLDLTKMELAFKTIANEIKDIKTNGVKAEELKKAKQFARGKITLSLEDAQDIAGFFGKQVMFSRELLTSEQIVAKYEQVKLSDLKRLANKLLLRGKMHVAAISPMRDLNKFVKYLDI